MWKTSIVAMLLGASLLAHAQQRPAQQVVQWQLQVMQDDQQVDSFEGTTTVGQAHTDTHHRVVQHHVGCKDQPAGSIDLSRTLTVSPLRVDPEGVTMSIETQETLEDAAPQRTDIGCKLPPQPRLVSGSHPGLVVPPDQWASWTIVASNPKLVYRLHASVVANGNDGTNGSANDGANGSAAGAPNGDANGSPNSHAASTPNGASN
ncbi:MULTISPECIES: hypothetical protein [Burkholderiaceae]|uniref:hypothetical protein n=1 Tax=Burkholderiaceae TaxID=119060 RepID=UPI00141DDC32|nr:MULTISPECIES: hypothetical protein [Burkholderiaceae]NIF53180.1 hypothetical protein [Burkholderia sp. Ax-1724]NIF76745.1 hypothetical protein [Paraburkholderia sp. Cy-641]